MSHTTDRSSCIIPCNLSVIVNMVAVEYLAEEYNPQSHDVVPNFGHGKSAKRTRHGFVKRVDNWKVSASPFGNISCISRRACTSQHYLFPPPYGWTRRQNSSAKGVRFVFAQEGQGRLCSSFKSPQAVVRSFKQC